mmetsp:Transcript_25393/g.71266  ORF Transcript_25393/g.71266 Transcript_25393/m.71266 type:complete len:249 (-) Transcript_25393:366-1112(-)
MSLASSATNQSNCFPLLETIEKLRSSTRNRTVASPWRTKLPAGLPGANKVAADRVDECTSRSSYHFSLDVERTKKRRTGSRFIRKLEEACIVRKPLLLRGTARANFFKASTSRGACDSSRETSSRAATAQPMKSIAPASTSLRARSSASRHNAWTSKKPAWLVARSERQSRGAFCGLLSPIEALRASSADATPANRAATSVMFIDAAAKGNGPSSSFAHVAGWCSSACSKQCKPSSPPPRNSRSGAVA